VEAIDHPSLVTNRHDLPRRDAARFVVAR